MTTEPKDGPGKKMRKLLGSSSLVVRLPKKTTKNISSLPKLKEEFGGNTAPASPKPRLVSSSDGKPPSPSKNMPAIFGPLLWNVASVISLTANVILVLVIIVLAFSLNRYGLRMSTMLNMGNGLLGGLYTNFEKMDRAHITTNIDVSTTIPVQFDLQLNQQTNVVLSQDVTIDNALVTVNTGGLNITRAATTIVLPQGTILPVVLNLTVPVNTTVPVVLNVPVDIPMDKTQLHEPFTGLQDVVKPFYCMINNNAVNLNGEPICK